MLCCAEYYTTVPSDVGWFPAFNPSRSPPPLDKMAGGIAKQWEASHDCVCFFRFCKADVKSRQARFGIPYTLPAGALTRSELESAIDQLRVQAGESKRWSYSIAALLPPAFVTNGSVEALLTPRRVDADLWHQHAELLNKQWPENGGRTLSRGVRLLIQGIETVLGEVRSMLRSRRLLR